jgi:hypothetical protein
LREDFDKQTVDCKTVSRLASRFCEGCVTINDDQGPGMPKTSTDERSVKLVEDFLTQNHRETCKEILQAAGISPTSVFRILTKDLQKRQFCARWLPHCLTVEQKQKSLESATLMKQRFDIEGQAFLYRKVVIYETWVTDFELDLKWQSNECRSPTSPLPKTFRRTQSNFKQMMIFDCDYREIIMTDRVPCGTSVTAAYYRNWIQTLRRKMYKN